MNLTISQNDNHQFSLYFFHYIQKSLSRRTEEIIANNQFSFAGFRQYLNWEQTGEPLFVLTTQLTLTAKFI